MKTNGFCVYMRVRVCVCVCVFQEKSNVQHRGKPQKEVTSANIKTK